MLQGQCGQGWELKTPRGPHHRGIPQFCEISLQEFDQAPTEILEKNPFMLQEGRGGKEPFWNTPELSDFLNKTCFQGKLVNHSLTCLILSKSNRPGRREICNFISLSPPKAGREKPGETFVKCTLQRHRLTELKHKKTECFPSPHISRPQYQRSIYRSAFFPVHHVQLARKSYKVFQMAKNTIWRDSASLRTRHSRDVAIIRLGM